MTFYISNVNSPLGNIVLLSDGKALTGLYLQGQLDGDFNIDDGTRADDLEIFKATRTYLDAYFKGEKPSLTFLVTTSGTPFQMLVFDELRNIPYGTTVTYGELSKVIAKKRGLTHMSARAIGHAVGQNKVALIIPCHRVIGANSKLTGYAGGLILKQKLLQLEGHDLAKFK